MKNNGILRVLARFLIPLIFLVGLYIQFHGEYSPGGGFQAGLVFSAGWILYVLIYGLERGLRAVPLKAMYLLSAAGVLMYALTGLAGVLLGGNYLEFTQFLANPQSAQQAGIIIVELGVGLTVAMVAMLIFTLFVRRRRQWDDALDEKDDRA
ncbi:MAG: Na(+)/H(+) antiporter subunit B [Xanthomonadaceae bacterium]|nr:Na(+)/H(+) antiporter subunit B [Xanthomonadaceae bacterium]